MRGFLFFFLALPILALGCASLAGGIDMKNDNAGKLVAAKGDTVQVDYIGRFENGTVFDTNIFQEARKAGLPLRDRYDLLEFEVGGGQMIAGFDEAVIGMREGEEKTVSIPPEKAYGRRTEEAVVSVPLDKVEGGDKAVVGSLLYANNGAVGRVTKIENGSLQVDFNHELAGKELIFTIRMVKIKKK